MNRPPRAMQLSAAPTRTEVTKPAEEVLSKALRESIIKLMQTTVLSTARVKTAAIPTVARPHEAADLAMESVSSRSSTKSGTRRADEDPDDLFDLDIGAPRTTAAILTATAGGVGLARVRLCGVAGSAKSARSLVRLTNCARTPTNGGGTPICRDVC
ncbi:hypothetical protein PR003_g32561 [Phytophthora rubi]|uniref:Uncharacterized protein n=1 Tax=Phytophthora rubi TaxID=129364 RepID=A0A6A3GWE0_9STRA|nr:hypothetical protein PR001_g30090 [Phytophthora rubi]KAE9265111.1 hypothetical protein PR003_g32561 [Phytophthora rubi]